MPRLAMQRASARSCWSVGVAFGVASGGIGLFFGCGFGIDVGLLTACADRSEACPSDMPDVGGDGGKNPDDAGSPMDGGSDARAERCASTRGADMVFVQQPSRADGAGFCIDRTEVTNEQYAAFLGAKDALAPASVACTGDTTHVPQHYPPPPGSEGSPVVFVDFCDAEAYCAWAGKVLCGRTDGSPLSVTDVDDPERDAWFLACGGPARAYPYGDAYDARACNGLDRGFSGPKSADPTNTCRAPSGALDLSGNVWEWTHACEGESMISQRCHARGGAFNAPAAELTCTSVRFVSRDTADATTGFRCCAPASP